MNKNLVNVGDIVRVDEEFYIVSAKHIESAFCRNQDTGFNAFIDYADIEEIVK